MPDATRTGLPEPVHDLARAAQEYVRRAIRVEMDIEPEALAFLDHYASTVPADSAAIHTLLAPPLGAFFGEVARRRLDGRWAEIGGDPLAFRVELESAFLYFHPVAIAADVLARGGDLEPGVDPRIVVASVDEEELARDLSRTPVEEEYFYSFTGRLETLERMADFLVARRASPDRMAPPGEPPIPAPVPPSLYAAEIASRRS